MKIKNLIRATLNTLHLDITKNLKYDRLTKNILKKIIHKNANCIDVGCHEGEILNSIIKLSPYGRHWAFEPIPQLYNHLKKQYSEKVTVLPYALSDKKGNTKFQYVKNAPAYSGISKRKYKIAKPDIEEIEVDVRTLDELIPTETKIDFIKIDVEGGEFGVLKGAYHLLKKNKPFVIFECGLGASDYYGTQPGELYTYLSNKAGLQISLLSAWIKNRKPLSEQEFVKLYNKNLEYYFIAYSDNNEK